MDKQIRAVSLISMALVIVLMASTTLIQAIRADDLSSNGYNTRAIYEEFDKARGPILVAGSDGRPKAVAYSEPIADSFKYQRKYADANYSPVTGFFSIANVADRGVEAAMNSELNGDISELALANFADFVLQKEPQGAAVMLTLNDALQTAAMQALESSGSNGAVVATEPATGRVLALASWPAVDFNTFAIHDTAKASDAYSQAASDPASPLANRALSEIYPPGSTFKLVTSAAALETGQYTPETIIDAPLTYTLPGTVTDLPNASGGNCRASGGRETLRAALENSCNTAFAILGNNLGVSKMAEEAEKFGINDTFSLTNGNSNFQMVSARSNFPKTARADQLAMDSIGQGDVALTPLQVCLISAAIANGGQLQKPYLIDSLQTLDGGIIRSTASQSYGQVLSAGVAKSLQEMALSDVDNGVASSAAVPGIKVGGKTGTAENTPGLAPHSWFTGFAPVDNPKIAISVFLENGSNSGHEAAKAAGKLIAKYLEGAAK